VDREGTANDISLEAARKELEKREEVILGKS